MKKILFFTVCLITGIQFGFSQTPSVKTSVDKKQIIIGEQLQYNVEASFPVNTFHVNWFNVPDSFSHFEVVNRGKIDSVESNGILTCKQTLTLTSFDSGLYTIPALKINFDPLVDDTTVNLFTDSIPINISYSPLDSTQTFHDIKSIIEVKDEIPLWMWIGGAAFLILIIVLVIYLVKYFKRRKNSTSIFKSKLSPIDEAIQALDALQKEQLLSKGETKQFHVRLTDIFKRYVYRKTEKNVLNLTSSEILLALNETLLSKEDTSLAAESLRMTDAVKFAKYTPPVYQSESALINTKKVIEQIDKLIFTEQNSKQPH